MITASTCLHTCYADTQRRPRSVEDALVRLCSRWSRAGRSREEEAWEAHGGITLSHMLPGPARRIGQSGGRYYWLPDMDSSNRWPRRYACSCRSTLQLSITVASISHRFQSCACRARSHTEMRVSGIDSNIDILLPVFLEWCKRSCPTLYIDTPAVLAHR